MGFMNRKHSSKENHKSQLTFNTYCNPNDITTKSDVVRCVKFGVCKCHCIA